MIQITALMENTACTPAFTPEHGLSLYIMTPKHRLLFDTGQTGTFADNAAKLGVDLSRVDALIVSHGHFDHGGGIGRFLEANDHAPIYVNHNALGSFYNAKGKYIGLSLPFADHPELAERLVLTKDETVIDEELALYTCNERSRRYRTDSAGLTEETAGKIRRADPFLHEQYLLIRAGKKRILISGCSHKGILNLLEWFHPDILIGGFHFMNLPVEEGYTAALDQAAEVLGKYDAEYYTCHCTGIPQYHYLKSRMGEKLHYLSTGETLKF